MLYRIYCLKNEDNEVVYVGQTNRELDVRLKEHHRRFENRKTYKIELIDEVYSSEEADRIETYYIKLFDTVCNGDNTTYGKGTKGLGANGTSFKKGNNLCKMGTKKVKCIETGILYESLTECAKELNLSVKAISDVCRGRRKTTGKLHFEYA